MEGAVVGGGVVAAEGRWGWWVEGRSAVDMVDGSLLGGVVGVELSGSRLRASGYATCTQRRCLIRATGTRVKCVSRDYLPFSCHGPTLAMAMRE